MARFFNTLSVRGGRAIPYMFIFLIYLTVIRSMGNAKIPHDIKLCHKYDPDLDICLVRLFESLRPRLISGIPEAGLPALDPLYLSEVDISLGRQGRMWFHNVKVKGISNFKLNYIRTEIKKLQAAVSITFPFLEYEGFYNVDGRFMNFNLKGKGPIKGNATQVTSTALLKGKIVRDIENNRYVEFTQATVNVTLVDYGIRIDELFTDKDLNDQVNALMNDKESRYRKFSMQTAKPIIDRVAGKMLLEMVNKVAKNFSFDEVFQ